MKHAARVVPGALGPRAARVRGRAAARVRALVNTLPHVVSPLNQPKGHARRRLRNPTSPPRRLTCVRDLPTLLLDRSGGRYGGEHNPSCWSDRIQTSYGWGLGNHWGLVGLATVAITAVSEY